MKCFQRVDQKSFCNKIYYNGEIISDIDMSEFDGTWDLSPNFSADDLEYAQLYCRGASLTEVCPSGLEERWEEISKRMKAYLKCFGHAQISLEEHCFYDMVPQHFLLEFFEIKNRITQYVLKKHKKPHDYNFLRDLTALVFDIKHVPLKFSMNNIDAVLLSRKSNKNLIKKINSSKGRISYNMYGTRTGRLTTNSGSFPILTLKKEFRKGIEPQNDLFVELDFNAAELRTLLALCGKEQPEEDIHAWNAKNVFRGLVTRKEAKERIFAWLYNPDSKDHLANRAYDRFAVKEKYWDGKMVTTPLGRKIEADDFHALNYIIQSTTSDLFLRRAIALHKLLSTRKSRIAFTIHDSLVVDFANEDKEIFKKMIETFSDTPLGRFKVNVGMGSNFGSLRKIS